MTLLSPRCVHDARQVARDPTGTRVVRRAFETDLRRRWRMLEVAVRDVVEVRDAFGLKPGSVSQAYDSAGKVRAFQSWIDATLSSIIVGSDMWFMPHLNKSYAIGQRRARSMTGAEPVARINSLRVVAEAVRSDLQGIAEAFSQRVVRGMADAVMASQPLQLFAREIIKAIRDVGLKRSQLLASYSAVKAHASGTLDALESAGIDTVGIEVETLPRLRIGDRDLKPKRKTYKLRTRTKRPIRSGRRRQNIEQAEKLLQQYKRVNVETAGDDKVCPICEEIAEEGPYKIDRARSLIPAHPNCRCAFVAVNKGGDT